MIKEDKRAQKRLKNILHKAAQNACVAVGILQDEPHTKNFTMVDLALVHEYGSKNGHIPARSFIRSTCDANQKEHFECIKKLEKKYFQGHLTLKQALSQLGAIVASDMRQAINLGKIKPDIKAATKRRKKSSKPLIDTGRLKGAIMHEVRGV
jgi:phage gpG-like protein